MLPPFNTDKVSYHEYYPVYCDLAEKLGPDADVCEVGVHEGESLRMWQALFPSGTITGVDCNEDCTWPAGTIKVVCGQADPNLPGLLGSYDLIVDDASHDGVLTRDCFNLLWPSVKPGGYYVIEDWTVALRDDIHWGYCWGDGMLRAVEGLLPLLSYKDSECDFITYRYGLAIAHKRVV